MSSGSSPWTGCWRSSQSLHSSCGKGGHFRKPKSKVLKTLPLPSRCCEKSAENSNSNESPTGSITTQEEIYTRTRPLGHARSTPSLRPEGKQKKVKRSTSRGRINNPSPREERRDYNSFQRTSSTELLTRVRVASRDRDLPVKSLPGPPVPPRASSHINIAENTSPEPPRNPNKMAPATDPQPQGQGQPSGKTMRRSNSELKMEKRNIDRAVKSKSIHFDDVGMDQGDDQLELKPLSIIGRQQSEPNGRAVSENNVNQNLPSGNGPSGPAQMLLNDNDVPPPPPGKRKVIVAQRPNSFIWNLKSKIKRKRFKSQGAKSEDEGFDSPNSAPMSPSSLDPGLNNVVNGIGVGGGAPLAKEEDLDDVEKHETEATKETNAKKELTADEKKKMLRKYPYFRLDIVADCGKDLLAMDRGVCSCTGGDLGTSDPYLKCIHGQDKLFQTRSIQKTVNPKWEEAFSVHVDNPFKPISFQVFDKDMVGSDDFMGEASLELTDLNLTKTEEFTLALNDGNNEDLMKKNKKRKPLGSIMLSIAMNPMTKEEMNEFVQSREEIYITRKFSIAGGGHESLLRQDSQVSQILRAEKMGKGGKGKAMTWSACVHVVMVQARGLMAMDAGESSDPYCKIALGKERCKTKSISCTINPKWREAFDLYWYEEIDNEMEISVWDKDVGSKDDFMGRVRVDLRKLDKEKTHNLWMDVEDFPGKVNFLITISGTTRGDSPSNLANWEEDLDKMKAEWVQQYKSKRSFKAIKDVGHLMVKVFKARGLASADLGGKSDPFAVVELNNDRVQTHTEYKTLTPSWQKVFQFNVKDIHDVLEITVYDEDKDHKYEFLGKVAVPLLRIRNSEKKWYQLKDKKLRTPAKGDNPAIMLEMFFVYNKVRASIRTFNPKQLKYEDRSDIKFKHSVFMRNVNRVKAATADFDPDLVIREITSILNWESKPKSAGAFIGFLLGVYFFEPWMITLGLLIPFIKNIVVLSVTGGWNKMNEGDEVAEEDDDDEAAGGGGKEKEEEKKSLKEKMQAMQEITLMVQNGLGMLAHVLESCANVFNFCVPFLSWLAFFVVAVVTLVLYYIPLRYLLMAWGTNKFTKKLIRPNAINNNELADFISRVPDNEELKNFRELPSPEAVSQAKVAAKKKPASDADVI